MNTNNAAALHTALLAANEARVSADLAHAAAREDVRSADERDHKGLIAAKQASLRAFTRKVNARITEEKARDAYLAAKRAA